MPELDRRIADLLDRAEIADLLTRYGVIGIDIVIGGLIGIVGERNADARAISIVDQQLGQCRRRRRKHGRFRKLDAAPGIERIQQLRFNLGRTVQ